MQGKTLLDRLKGGDVVIITQLDRLFRVALDTPGLLAELKEHGISLDVIDLGGDVTGDGISKLVFIFTTSSWAVAAERERLAAIRRCQRARGGYRGGIPPFGWRVGDGGALVKVPEQQEALPRMHRLRADGTPFRAIAEQMRADGIQISHAGVKKVLDAAARLRGCAGRGDGEDMTEVPPLPWGRRRRMSPPERAKIVAALLEMRSVTRVALATGWSPPTVGAIAKAENIWLAHGNALSQRTHGSAKRRERAD